MSADQHRGETSMSKPTPSTSSTMRQQGGVNEMPRDQNPGSEEDAPLPTQPGFVVIDGEEDSDEGISSDEEGGGQVMNGGYQLLAQDPDGNLPETSDEDSAIPSTTDATPTAPVAAPSFNDSELLHQASSASHSSSSSHPHLPQHLATLMPAQIPQPDQATRVSYSDTMDVREQRRQTMAGDDQIRAAMAGFSLPSAAQPQWANFVTEQDWKKNLGSRLGDKREKRTQCDKNDSTDSSEHSGER